jgi:hypothetical protein
VICLVQLATRNESVREGSPCQSWVARVTDFDPEDLASQTWTALWEESPGSIVPSLTSNFFPGDASDSET